jgi:hypothetical protein
LSSTNCEGGLTRARVLRDIIFDSPGVRIVRGITLVVSLGFACGGPTNYMERLKNTNAALMPGCFFLKRGSMTGSIIDA